MKRIRVFINPKSGQRHFSAAILSAIQKYWDRENIELTYQFSKSVGDGKRKVKQAIRDGIETVLIVGGDGIISSIGSELVGTDIVLGAIPTGSGNGFARHFNIPLDPKAAIRTLFNATEQRIDVGLIDKQPFLVTCSIAWDAAIVHQLEKLHLRGILPYFLAGAQQFFEYKPQVLEIDVDGERITLDKPLIFTVANLTQYGGGAKIAPTAKPNDGFLEMVTVPRQNIPELLGKIHRLFGGTIDQVDSITTRKFKRMELHCSEPFPVQVDGELESERQRIVVEIAPQALSVLVPTQTPDKKRSGESD